MEKPNSISKNRYNYIWPSNRTYWMKPILNISAENLNILVNNLVVKGYHLENWCPAGNGIKFSLSNYAIPEQNWMINGSEYKILSTQDRRKAVVISRLPKAIRQDNLKEKLMESFLNSGLAIQDFKIIELFRKDVNGRRVVSSSIKLEGLDEGIIDLLVRKGWISIFYRVYPLRRYV